LINILLLDTPGPPATGPVAGVVDGVTGGVGVGEGMPGVLAVLLELFGVCVGSVLLSIYPTA
jgi:hypothetical protein